MGLRSLTDDRCIWLHNIDFIRPINFYIFYRLPPKTRPSKMAGIWKATVASANAGNSAVIAALALRPQRPVSSEPVAPRTSKRGIQNRAIRQQPPPRWAVGLSARGGLK